MPSGTGSGDASKQRAAEMEAGKRAAAARALDLLEPGMKIGLGTGSTAEIFIELLGERLRRDRLDITGVPTSKATGRAAQRAGVPLTTLGAASWLDLTVDGADEVDPNLTLIKGGGGALLIEKIVASASDRMVVIADDSKRVSQLGAFPLPVEVTPFGWQTTAAVIEATLDEHDVDGRKAVLRLKGDAPFLTDEGNMIVDLKLKRIGDPERLAANLNLIPGVVDTGLFVGIADLALFGRADGGVERLGDAAPRRQ
ncbi:MAG: ribose-5-phosphate isomerase RpiA [Pseudomonadota bacterium]